MLSASSGAEVQCSVTIEYLNTASQATKRKTVRNAIITLGRNEFRDILVRVHDGKLSQSFILREIQLFTQFIRDGKSSIKLIPDNIQILVSNCPPDKLKVFFKTLSIKYAADKKASKPLFYLMLVSVLGGIPECQQENKNVVAFHNDVARRTGIKVKKGIN
eukprot:g23142.t1